MKYLKNIINFYKNRSIFKITNIENSIILNRKVNSFDNLYYKRKPLLNEINLSTNKFYKIRNNYTNIELNNLIYKMLSEQIGLINYKTYLKRDYNYIDNSITAFTEKEAGSDLSNIKSYYNLDTNNLYINKHYITNALNCKNIVFFIKIIKDDKEYFGYIIIDKPEILNFKKQNINNSFEIYEINFNDIIKKNTFEILYDKNDKYYGFKLFNKIIKHSRGLGLPNICNNLNKIELINCEDFLNNRIQFNKPLINQQILYNRLEIMKKEQKINDYTMSYFNNNSININNDILSNFLKFGITENYRKHNINIQDMIGGHSLLVNKNFLKYSTPLLPFFITGGGSNTISYSTFSLNQYIFNNYISFIDILENKENINTILNILKNIFYMPLDNLLDKHFRKFYYNNIKINLQIYKYVLHINELRNNQTLSKRISFLLFYNFQYMILLIYYKKNNYFDESLFNLLNNKIQIELNNIKYHNFIID